MNLPTVTPEAARPGFNRLVLGVALVAVAVSAGAAARLLATASWDPSVFVKLGTESGEIIEYVEERLGKVNLSRALGHDGKFFFVQANDPFYLEPTTHAVYLDRPAYRAQRMLYPVLSGGLGFFGPKTIVWAMPVVTIAAMAAGTWATAQLAYRRERSPWLGLAFGLNIGLIMELFIGGAGALAWALAVAGVLAAETSRRWWATAALTGSVLTREVMVLAAVGLLVGLWLSRRERWWQVAVVPVAAAASWAVYVRARLPSGVAAQVEEIGIPFRGLAIAASSWLHRPFDLLVGVTVLAVCVIFVVRVLRGRDPFGWSALGFALLLPLLSEQVLLRYFDILRAVAPVLTGYVVVTMAPIVRADLRRLPGSGA